MPYSYPPHNANYKLDSAYAFDTCGIKLKSIDCDSSLMLNYFIIADGRERLYAKELWVVWFDVKAFNLPRYDPDTLIELTWRDADSINFPAIKDSLEILESIYGNYRLRKLEPEYTEPDDGQTFLVYFENYVNGVNIENKFRLIPYAHCDFMGGISKVNAVESNEKTQNKNIQISPNPASEYIEINLVNVVETGLRPVSTGFSEGIRVYNALGECVKNPTPALVHTPAPLERGIREGVLRIDVSDLPAGVYFIRIGDAVKSFVKI